MGVLTRGRRNDWQIVRIKITVHNNEGNANVTSEDVGAFTTLCTNGDGVKSGIKVLHIGLGTVTLS